MTFPSGYKATSTVHVRKLLDLALHVSALLGGQLDGKVMQMLQCRCFSAVRSV